ncbi:hypothetical protein M8J75_013234 [Diaphorina citri]|nr:hypothetical protein M8J75_013234 [Diaphorina citri]KAI5735716.1 hypothetical protein M8J77_021780 [Diaphorina citri]
MGKPLFKGYVWCLEMEGGDCGSPLQLRGPDPTSPTLLDLWISPTKFASFLEFKNGGGGVWRGTVVSCRYYNNNNPSLKPPPLVRSLNRTNHTLIMLSQS